MKKKIILIFLIIPIGIFHQTACNREDRFEKFYPLNWNPDFMKYSIDSNWNRNKLIRASFVLNYYGYSTLLLDSELKVEKKVFSDTRLWMNFSIKLNDTNWLKQHFYDCLK